MKFTRLDDWLRWQETLHPSAIDLGLDRVRRVWDKLGDRPAPCVITVGGTNGKGSCVAYLDAILRAAGYRVGCYTSPHLMRYNERITIDGQQVSDEDLVAVFQRVEDARGDISLTYFEFGTLAAFCLFAQRDLDVAVLEVGLGGRLDAVNIIDADAALVTTVDLDHAAWLGPDRESIGREKAGILRAGKPAVYGETDPPLSLLQVAEGLGVSLWIAGRDFRSNLDENGWSWQAGKTLRHALPLPALRGRHQIGNAAAVLAVLHLLSERLPVDQRALRAGLVAVSSAGRFQVLPGRPRVVLDVAHNPQAARVLAENLELMAPRGHLLAVFSALADKDIPAIVAPLKRMVKHWYLAPLEGPRALNAGELTQRLTSGGDKPDCSTAPSITEAFDAAMADAGPEDIIVAFGSFLVVGAMLNRLGEGLGSAKASC